jgi:hypothetical protein
MSDLNPKNGNNKGLEETIRERPLSPEEKMDLLLKLVSNQKVVQEVNVIKEPLPIMCVRQQLPKYFPGQSVATWANWASQKIGPKYYRKGKTTWYKLNEVEDYLRQNGIETTQEK